MLRSQKRPGSSRATKFLPGCCICKQRPRDMSDVRPPLGMAVVVVAIWTLRKSARSCRRYLIFAFCSYRFRCGNGEGAVRRVMSGILARGWAGGLGSASGHDQTLVGCGRCDRGVWIGSCTHLSSRGCRVIPLSIRAAQSRLDAQDVGTVGRAVGGIVNHQLAQPRGQWRQRLTLEGQEVVGRHPHLARKRQNRKARRDRRLRQ